MTHLKLSKPEFEAAMDAAAEANAALQGARATSAANRAKIAAFKEKVAEIRSEFDARSAELDEREAALPRLRRRIAEETRDEVRRECYAAERSAAKVQADEALKAYLERLRSQPIPLLVEEYLDRTDPSGRSYRRGFERFVDQRLARFEVEHGVAGDLELESGDREQFIEDGGERLGAEVAQLQRERGYGE